MNLPSADAYRLPDELRRQSADRPDAPALTDGGTTCTYREFDERTSRLAQALVRLGVTPGARVAVLDRSSNEVVEVLFGAAKAGAVTVPLNWRLAAPELVAVLGDAGASVLIAGEEFAAVADQVADALAVRPALVVVGRSGTLPAYDAWLAAARAEDPGWSGTADDVVVQLYTSGTTGLPKGVLITNRNLGACAQAGAFWGFDESSTSLCAMPMFHIAGLGFTLIGIAHGGHTVIVRDLVPADVLEILEARRITNVFFVPAVIQMLVDLPGAAQRDYSALRSMAYGASPITPALLRRAIQTFGRPLFQLYGLTETTGAVTQLDAEDHDPEGPKRHLMTSAGRPYPWVELKVVDVHTGETLPPGRPGEVCIRSPLVTPGYFNKPLETKAAIDEDGWFHSGDVGELDTDGYLYLRDRLKDMVITGGENVYPGEVEAVLAEHPAVAAAAVIGLPDQRWGEAVTAVVVPRTGESPQADELIAFARARIAPYKSPKRIVLIDALPLNPSGKVLKRVLREQLS